MTVSYNQIPGNLRVPFQRFEVNAGQSPYQSIARLILWGQKLMGGVAAVSAPVLVTGEEDSLFGAGSMLAGMYKTARANAPFQEIWCVPLADAAGAVAATGSIAFPTSGSLVPLAAADTLVVYVGGIRVALPISTTMTSVQIAAALVAAINACAGMQVMATVDGTTASKVNLVANNAGTCGNTIRVETRLAQDDGPLADAICTIIQPSGGTGDPTTAIDTAIAAMGNDLWDWNVVPYCTTSVLNQFKTWLDARWGPMDQTYGHVISAMTGSAGTVQAFTSVRNNSHETIMPMNNGPQPTYLLAAAVGAQCAAHLQSAPELSRPLQTLALTGIRAPKALGDRFAVVARQSLYYAGASGYTVDIDGTVRLDRVLTTYQRNAYQLPDMAFLDVNTIAQIMFGLRYIADYMVETYPRCALVDANPDNLQDFVTATDIRNGYIHAYSGLVAIGVFENADVFASLLVVERNVQDPNRVDAYLPLDSVNQLRILAGNATSYLQYPVQ